MCHSFASLAVIVFSALEHMIRLVDYNLQFTSLAKIKAEPLSVRGSSICVLCTCRTRARFPQVHYTLVIYNDAARHSHGTQLVSSSYIICRTCLLPFASLHYATLSISVQTLSKCSIGSKPECPTEKAPNPSQTQQQKQRQFVCSVCSYIQPSRQHSSQVIAFDCQPICKQSPYILAGVRESTFCARCTVRP